MKHSWSRNFLFAGRAPSEAHPDGKPPVESWATCATCGAQICQMGYGKKSFYVYRARAIDEWATVEPTCRAAPALSAPLRGWVEEKDGSWRWSKKVANA